MSDEKKNEEVEEVKAEAAAEGAAEASSGEEKSEALKKAEAILGEDTSKPRRRPQGDRRGNNNRHDSRDEEQDNLFEKVVFINRCAKVVKGGRRFSFSALVVTGDQEGNVGFGFGKALEVAECIKKASGSAKKQMTSVKITENTIPHPVVGIHGGGKVLLMPASPGTGLIAGGGVRAVVEAAGIKDVLAKSMGSNNHANVVKATLNALEQLRNKEDVYKLRGKKIESKKAL
ncbi:MAG: 30S ribosomal protein S5 [Verrucomicrobiota bacterium]